MNAGTDTSPAKRPIVRLLRWLLPSLLIVGWLAAAGVGGPYFGKIDEVSSNDQASYLPPAKYALVHNVVLDKCDALDGATDRLIENPRACTFDPKVLACTAGDGANCLTAAQVETVRAMYTPLAQSEGIVMRYIGHASNAWPPVSAFARPQSWYGR